MAKLPEDVINDIYKAGYKAGYKEGVIDGYKEASDMIEFLSKAACNVLQDEIRDIKKR